jgi:hypothetical protein
MATVRIQVRRGTASQWSTTNPVLAAGEMGVETDTNKFKFGNGTATWSALSYANADTAGITEISQDAINAALSMGTGLTKTYNDGANTITIAIDDTVWANRSYVTSAISSLSNTVDSTYIPLDDRGAANGVASLNAQGKVPTSETDLTVMATRAYAEYLQTQDLLALDVHKGKTTDVHGIPDVSLLATLANVGTARTDLTTYTNTKFDTAQTYTDTKFDAAKTYTDAEIDETVSYVNTQHGLAMTAATNAGTSANTYTDSKSTQDRTYADGAVSGHSADTTDVHGIADTTLLATKSYADTASSTAQTAAIAAADTALGVHTADTTNVHGIADTSLLATTANVATAKSEAITAAGTAADTKVSTAVAALTKSSVGLANVDNTADSAKPVSTAQASAIATAKSEAIADATSQVNALLTGAPAALNTLDELAAALGDDANFASTVTTNLALKAPLASPTFTGTVTVAAAGVAFTDGTQTKEGVPSRTPIIQKTAAYTLSSLTERDNLIEVSSASAVAVTIPADATVNYPIGTSVDILQSGTGQVSIAGAGGVTVNATPGLKLRTQWSSATLLKRAANTWIVMGDLSA